MKLKNVKVGQRVALYTHGLRYKCTVKEIDSASDGDQSILVSADEIAIEEWTHPKQLRLIKPKKKKELLECWVNVYKGGNVFFAHSTKESAREYATHPDTIISTIKMREVEE